MPRRRAAEEVPAAEEDRATERFITGEWSNKRYVEGAGSETEKGAKKAQQPRKQKREQEKKHEEGFADLQVGGLCPLCLSPQPFKIRVPSQTAEGLLGSFSLGRRRAQSTKKQTKQAQANTQKQRNTIDHTHERAKEGTHKRMRTLPPFLPPCRARTERHQTTRDRAHAHAQQRAQQTKKPSHTGTSRGTKKKNITIQMP